MGKLNASDRMRLFRQASGKYEIVSAPTIAELQRLVCVAMTRDVWLATGGPFFDGNSFHQALSIPPDLELWDQASST